MDAVLFRLGQMLTDVGGAAGALFSPTTEREAIIEWIRGANRWQHYQLFEMAAAAYSDTLPLDMLPLTDGPERVFARVRAVHPPLDWPADDIDRIWDAYLDRGFDSATTDFARTVQAKWYAPGRAVTFTAAATFNTASQIVQRGRVNFERQLIHSEGSRVPLAVAATPDMQFVEMSNIVLADIFVRALQEFGARREILQGARIDDEMREIVAQNDDAASDTTSAADDAENTDESEFDSASDSGGNNSDTEDGSETEVETETPEHELI